MALIESIGDPTLTVGLSQAAIMLKLEAGELADVMRWSQRVIELADGDPTRGNFLWGSPLAAALAMRGAARWIMGRSGWRDDLEQAIAIARGADPMSQALVITYKYFVSIPAGVLLPDDRALCEIDEALQIAERSGDDQALGLAQLTMGLTLVHRGVAEDRDRGLEVLAQIRDMCLHERFILSELPIVEVWTAFVRAKRGDHDLAIPPMRKALDDLFDDGQFAYCVAATGVLVDTLLNRGFEADIREAEAAIDRMAAAPAGDGLVLSEIMLLRLRALWLVSTALTRSIATSG